MHLPGPLTVLLLRRWRGDECYGCRRQGAHAAFCPYGVGAWAGAYAFHPKASALCHFERSECGRVDAGDGARAVRIGVEDDEDRLSGLESPAGNRECSLRTEGVGRLIERDAGGGYRGGIAGRSLSAIGACGSRRPGGSRRSSGACRPCRACLPRFALACRGKQRDCEHQNTDDWNDSHRRSSLSRAFGGAAGHPPPPPFDRPTASPAMLNRRAL